MQVGRRCGRLLIAVVAIVVAAVCGSSMPRHKPVTRADPAGPLWTFTPADDENLGHVTLDGDSGVLVDTYQPDQVGLGTSDGTLSLLEAGTGAVRWRTPTGYWSVVSVWPTPAGIVAQMTQDYGESAVWDFDRSDGQEVWSRDIDSGQSVAGVTGSGVVVVDDAAVETLSTSTGQPQWTQPSASGCAFDNAAADSDIVVVAESCPDRTVSAIALDVRTGARRWRWPALENAGEGAGVSISVSGPDTEVSSGSEEFLSGNGALFFQESSSAGSIKNWSWQPDGDLTMIRMNARGALETDRVDARTGGSTVLAGWPPSIHVEGSGSAASTTSSGRTDLALVTLPDPLLPPALVALDSATGQVSATPVFGESGSFLVSDHLVFLASSSDTLHGAVTAYSPSAFTKSVSRLDGTAPEWPKACDLLSAAVVAAEIKGQADPIPSELMAPDLPPASRCTYAPERTSVPTVEVQVQWDGTSAADAGTLLAQMGAIGVWNETAGIGDQAYSTHVNATSGPTSASEVLFRVKTLIIHVSVLGDERLAEPIARIVADDAARWEGGHRS